MPFAELKLPRVAQAYDALIHILDEQKLIVGDADTFELTPVGLTAVHAITQRYSLPAWFYNEYYQAVLHSRAHSLFCERVYGKDLCQHGMADMDQLHAALTELQLQANQTLLDFGCGDGRIAEYIAETTQTCVTGVDIADEAIRLAQARTFNKRDRLQFYWADIERGQGHFPTQSFDHILAIDSLFFARDQQMVTQVLLNHLAPNGKMGVFYICPPQVEATKTPLAKALHALGAAYRVKDFSAQNTQHWIQKKQVLLALEPMFKAEGNAFLFKNRLAECDGLEHFQRYLYLIAAA